MTDRPDPASEPRAASRFEPGRNCLAVVPADRAGVLVDGEAYFRAVRHAIEAATDTIMILAWDFDSRTGLELDEAGRPIVTVGQLLDRWVRGDPRRHVHVLIWDYPMVYGLDREFPPIYGLGWKPAPRIHICYDGAVPIGGSHHQKIVVVDDRIAFVGGMDLTGRRWDTSAHASREPGRVVAGKAYPPMHDVMMVVSGDAARALGDLARDRWRVATGRPPASGGSRTARALARGWRRIRPGARRIVDAGERWPRSIDAVFEDVPVAIARTVPPAAGDAPAEEVREIEALYLDLIRAARHCLYIENQYFTAGTLGQALAERLAEPEGPEIVVVVRLLSHGWLEALTMERLRNRLVGRLRAADRHGRFRVYYPHVAGLPEEECLDLHSKVMVVDDDVLCIGSANFASRSMGLDAECNLAVEAGGDRARAAAIAAFRDRLLAEHLGVEPESWRGDRSRPSLIAAIESARRSPEALATDERTLVPLDVPVEDEDVAGVVELVDPEATVPLSDLVEQFHPVGDVPVESGPGWLALSGAALVLAVLAAVWRWTPLSEIASGEMIVALARQTGDSPWTAPALLLGYVVGTFVIFPRPLLTVFGVLAFGPWIAFTLAMAGVLAATWANYVVGRRLPRPLVRRVAGRSLNRIMDLLRGRGVLAITAVRLVPIAPFAVPGIVAGAAHLPLRDVLLGTLLGNLPGTALTTILGDRLEAVLSTPQPIDYWLLGVVMVALVLAAYVARRLLGRLQVPLERS